MSPIPDWLPQAVATAQGSDKRGGVHRGRAAETDTSFDLVQRSALSQLMTMENSN